MSMDQRLEREKFILMTMAISLVSFYEGMAEKGKPTIVDVEYFGLSRVNGKYVLKECRLYQGLKERLAVTCQRLRLSQDEVSFVESNIDAISRILETF